MRYAFGAISSRSLPNDDVKFSYLRFRRQREAAAVNLSFFASYMKNHSCQAIAKVPHFVYFVQRDQHGIIAKHLTQRKVLF